MSRCLSERRLLNLQAGFGDPREQAHAEACPACAGRLDALTCDLDVLTEVLARGPMPHTRPMPSFRRWLPAAAGAGALGLAALLWVEVTVWRAVTYVPPSMRPEEASAMLTEVSLALFSLRGYAPVPAEASGEPADEDMRVCEGADWLVTAGCTPALLAHAGRVRPAVEESR
jgi:hypothetical protein